MKMDKYPNLQLVGHALACPSNAVQKSADTQRIGRIPTLDGWRAIAIAVVTIHHLDAGFYREEAAYNSNLTRFGAFGVEYSSDSAAC